MKHNTETPEFSRFQDLLQANPGLQEIWDISEFAQTGQELSQYDVESDLKNLLGKLEIDQPKDTSSSQTQKITLLKRPFAAFLAAALVLLAIGTSYFIIPVQTMVPYGETAMVTLPDGSTVELNSGSTFKYSRLFGLTNRTVTLNGEGYFDVQKDQMPFRIESNHVITEVLGTSFNVKSWDSDVHSSNVYPADGSHFSPGQTEVTVISGDVSVHAGGQTVYLTKGESGEWNPDTMQMTGPVTGQHTHALAWRNNALAFHEERLIDIFSALERRFDVNITWAKDVEELSGGPLTAYYSSPLQLDRILTDITTIKSLHFKTTSEGYHIQTNSVKP